MESYYTYYFVTDFDPLPYLGAMYGCGLFIFTAVKYFLGENTYVNGWLGGCKCIVVAHRAVSILMPVSWFIKSFSSLEFLVLGVCTLLLLDDAK